MYQIRVPLVRLHVLGLLVGGWLAAHVRAGMRCCFGICSFSYRLEMTLPQRDCGLPLVAGSLVAHLVS